MTLIPNTLRQLAAVVFRLGLVVSLWQGPGVWGHSHHATVSTLSDHFASYHAHDSNPLAMGWHWHLSLPSPYPEDHSGGSASSSQVTAVLTSHMQVDVTSSSALVVLWVAPSVSTNGGHPAGLRLHQVRGTIALRSPQTWLCRMSC